MKRIFWTFFYWFLSLVTIFIFKDTFKLVFNNFDLYYSFIIGIIISLLMRFFKNKAYRYNISQFRTFTHELTHIIFSLICLNRISNLNINENGEGSVQYYGRCNHIITLSPYCVPIYSLLLLFLSYFINQSYLFGIYILMGISYAFHLQTVFIHARPYQDDIKKVGKVVSYGFITFFNILFTILILLQMKYQGFDTLVKILNSLAVNFQEFLILI